jgi:sarcosine oxidase delta subunit
MGKCGICFEKQATWRVGPCKHKLCKDCFFRIVLLFTCPFCRGKVRSVNFTNFTKKQLVHVCKTMQWVDWKKCVFTRSNLANFCLVNQILDAAEEADIIFVVPRDPENHCENGYCSDCWRARTALDPWPNVTELREMDYVIVSPGGHA